MNAVLPVGFSIRPVTLEDITACHTLFNAVSQAQFGVDDWSIEDVRSAIESLNLANDGCVIFAPNGELLAYSDIHFVPEPPVFPQIRIMIHPDYDGHDIGKYILQWGEKRARTTIERCPPDLRVAYRIFVNDKHPPSVALVENFGMQPFRSSCLMQINKPSVLQTPTTLENFTIRPMRYPDELGAVVQTTMDTLYDMWGMLQEPFEVVFERYRQRIAEDSHFDPSLWFVVEDNASSELAGICLCDNAFLNDHDAGYINQLGVQRAYRRNGIANALLQVVLNQFWKRGKTRVTLGVDAESTTGAIQLYQKIGMVVVRSGMFYEKEIRLGRKINWARL